MDKKWFSNIIPAVVVILILVSVYFVSQKGGSKSKFKIDGLEETLTAIGAPIDEIKQCLDNADEAQTVNQQFKDAAAMNLNSTPASILINNDTGLAVNLPGAVPKEFLVQLIESFDDNRVEGDVLYNFEDQKIKITVTKPENLPDVTDEDNKKGSEDAKYTIIEYSDFECPYCATFHKSMEQLISESSDVLWVFRNFPLRSIHPYAQKKAEAGECVATIMGNDKFWEFAAEMYARQAH